MAKSRQVRIASFAELRALWKEDYAANERRLHEPGFQALAIYRFGVWIDGLGPALLRFPLRRLYFLLSALVRIGYGIQIYHTTEIGRRLQLAHAQSGVTISRYCRIGDDCVIRQNVTIGKLRSRGPNTEVPVLGNRVEIGAGAVLVGPIRIGDDVIIGANTVVREDVPAGCVVLPPAPEIRQRRHHGDNRAGRDEKARPGEHRRTERDAAVSLH